jgi:hypothetical protein
MDFLFFTDDKVEREFERERVHREKKVDVKVERPPASAPMNHGIFYHKR